MRTTTVVNGVPVVIGDAMMLFRDAAGGLAVQSKNTSVFFEDKLPMSVGDLVSPHGDGYDQHSIGVPMATGSPTVFVCGSPLCGEGHLAVCGHAADGTHTSVIPQLDWA
jgi:uncharacterized Zn-binding protein involved in type VI secretion